MHALAASLENELITGSRSAFCSASAGQKQRGKKRKMEREKGGREEKRGGGRVEGGRKDKDKGKEEREREREERWKKREPCAYPRDRCIRRRVSQIRNLLTMVRKAIHLDDRGESVIYWPVTPAPTWPAGNDYTFHTTRHVVSEARLLKKRGALPIRAVIIIRPLPPSPHRCDGCSIIYIASELSK